MTTIKVGLLGYGGAGRIFHGPLIMAEPRLQLHRIGSRDFTNKSLPHGVIGAPIAEVIADPDIDLIVIATPNDSHAALAERALHAGKHVVIDKPFALTRDEAASVVATSKEAGKVLSIFQNRRWDGGFLTARKLFGDGHLGPVNYGEFHFDRYSPAIKDRWREWDQPGAGILYDLGPHLLDQIMCLFGIPEAVTANVARQRSGAQVDDFFHIILEFGSARIVAHASSLMPDHLPRISLFGENASFFQFGFDGQEAALKRGELPGDTHWGTTPNGAAYLMGADAARTDVPILPGQYEAFYFNIADAICKGADLAVTGAQALDVMHVLDAAHLSAKSGHRTQL